jgi:hypothetical protein
VEARTLRVAGAALDLVEVARVLYGLQSFGAGHEERLDVSQHSNKDKRAVRC